MGCIQWKLDNENIQKILDSFVLTTGIPISYFDEEDNEIVGCEKTYDKKASGFCSRLQEIPEIRKACIQCDLDAFQKVSLSKHSLVYKCHMNLLEGLVPLYIENHLIGYFFIGKFVEENNEENTWLVIRKRLEKSKKSDDEIKKIYEYFKDIASIEKSKLESAGVLLEMLASFIVDYDYIKLAEMGKVDSIKKYIKNNLSRGITLSDIAAFHDISIPYMSTLFKKTTDITINTYINQQRLKKAKHLLVSSPLSIKEISAEVGYDNQNYFSRVFKKHVLISASEYRENSIITPD